MHPARRPDDHEPASSPASSQRDPTPRTTSERPLPDDIGPAPLADDVIEMMSSVAEGAALMWGRCGSLAAESSRAAASGTSFWVSGSVLLTRVPSSVLARFV